MGKYLLNKETQKIEMHFDKSEYLNLSEEQKKEIKSTFLWSGKVGAWISRSKNNHYYAIQLAEKLGLENAGKIGERLSYEEELERKSERAEARAERFENYSLSAEKRAENLQSAFNTYAKDWSWLTQPIINGHAGSRAFANHRNKIIARYERGFEEYQKSEYYKDRAETARQTADNYKLQDKVYLHNKIKEQNSILKKLQEYIINLENNLYKIQNGEKLYWSYTKSLITVEELEEKIEEKLEKYDYEQNKLEFFEKYFNDLGGNNFSKNNIKVGYIVEVKRWGKCEVLSVGNVNLTLKCLEMGYIYKEPYAVIENIIEEKELIEEKEILENPYIVDDILTYNAISSDYIIKAYQVIKVTKTGCKLQQIKVENGKPLKDNFITDEIIQKKIVKSKYNDFVGIYINDWQLYKYIEK